MLYAIQWKDPVAHLLRNQTGASIPDALHRASMWHGISFLNGVDKVYGIINLHGEFVRVPELDEPGRYTPAELEQIIQEYYKGKRGRTNEDIG